MLHVAVPGAALAAVPGAFTAPRYLDQPHHEWPSWVQEVLGQLRAVGHVPMAVKLNLFLATGEPGPAILRIAEDHQSDLIVVAWHGRLEEKRVQTLKAIVAVTPCPVLVLRVTA
jgi:nucleotide-binding universal stress UspA family protein